MSRPLSPAAQAVLNAAHDGANEVTFNDHFISTVPMCAAAALRAAADQVAPDDAVEPRNYLPMAIECQRIRRELFAIAAELETFKQ